MFKSIQKKIVGISGVVPSGPRRLLFESISSLYPVEFREVTAETIGSLDALISLDGDLRLGIEAAENGTPAFVVLENCREACDIQGHEVRFGTSIVLSDRLRRQAMMDPEGIHFCPLKLQPGDEILASKNGHPVWLNRKTGIADCNLVAISPPVLRENEFLFQHLNGRRYLRLLPLMNFLSRLVEDVAWQSPELPACFIFDDPSLYWRSYGFLNFRRLAEHAKAHNYVAAIATIPIDTWRISKTVASTFRTHHPWISLLVHGNNHTFCELLSNGKGDPLFLNVAAQAMRRMKRLEHGHGLTFAKIMEAPQAAMSHGVFEHLLAAGFEGALCSTELLVQNNPGHGWPSAFGMGKTEMLGGGLPVVPRIKMTPLWKNDVLLAAFLRQPIMIAGHHHDAARGMKLLEQIAGVVNGLKGVGWSPPHEMLTANYLYRIEGDVLAVKMLSRRINVLIPDGVRHLHVERPWLSEGNQELFIRSGDGEGIFSGPASAMAELVPVGHHNHLEVSSPIGSPTGISVLAAPRASPWPVVRKALMEARDRLYPMLAASWRLHRWRGDIPKKDTVE